jgi:hypothetical protein
MKIQDNSGIKTLFLSEIADKVKGKNNITVLGFT